MKEIQIEEVKKVKVTKGYKILVKHYYQEHCNPHIQTIVDNGEFYMRYALFKALLESHLDFDIVQNE